MLPSTLNRPAYRINRVPITWFQALNRQNDLIQVDHQTYKQKSSQGSEIEGSIMSQSNFMVGWFIQFNLLFPSLFGEHLQKLTTLATHVIIYSFVNGTAKSQVSKFNTNIQMHT